MTGKDDAEPGADGNEKTGAGQETAGSAPDLTQDDLELVERAVKNGDAVLIPGFNIHGWDECKRCPFVNYVRDGAGRIPPIGFFLVAVFVAFALGIAIGTLVR